MLRKTLLVALAAPAVIWSAPLAAAKGPQSAAEVYAAQAGRFLGLQRNCPGVDPEALAARVDRRMEALSNNAPRLTAARDALNRALAKANKRRAIDDPALCAHLKHMLDAPPVAHGLANTGAAPDFAGLGRTAGRALACTKHISDIETFSGGVLRLASRKGPGTAFDAARMAYASGLAYWYMAERFNAVHKCEFAAQDFVAAEATLADSTK